MTGRLWGRWFSDDDDVKLPEFPGPRADGAYHSDDLPKFYEMIREPQWPSPDVFQVDIDEQVAILRANGLKRIIIAIPRRFITRARKEQVAGDFRIPDGFTLQLVTHNDRPSAFERMFPPRDPMQELAIQLGIPLDQYFEANPITQEQAHGHEPESG